MIMKSIRTIKKIAGKKVLLRADFNVPIDKDKILDDFKIVASLPTIRFLVRYKCKIIIISHLGRPGGKGLKKYSLKPIVRRLSSFLDSQVGFVDDCVGFKPGNKISKMKAGEVLILENLRFDKGEEKNDKKFAKQLASYADVYVNNAFANSHRNHASMVAVKNFLPFYAGFLLEKEIENLNKAMHPRKPLVIILGGVKVATKIPLIKKFYNKASKILVGGVLANNFLAAHKLEIGRSLADKKSIALAKRFKSKNILLPIDVVVSEKKYGGSKATAKSVNKVKNQDKILDIGPETIKLYSRFIKKAQTIVWNGPMGMFENEHFKHGTLSIARVVASRSTGKAFGVVGGGETVEALKMTKMLDHVDWVSTGGGAMLAYLGKEKMPGLEKIK